MTTQRDASSAEPVLRVRQATVSYLGVKALSGVDLAAYAGEIVGVIGPNGAGKSTLVNLIAGVVRGEGDVILNGRSLKHQGPHRRARAGIARTFQTPELFGTLTAEENVGLAARSSLHRHSIEPEPETTRPHLKFRSTKSERVDSRTRWALERVGLDLRTDVRADSMAGGEKKLVELARALVQQPLVLMLDEPLAGVPAIGRRRTIESLRAFVDASQATCILIEHDMEVISQACDRLYVLSGGRVIKEGSWEDASQDEHVIRAYLGSAGQQKPSHSGR